MQFPTHFVLSSICCLCNLINKILSPPLQILRRYMDNGWLSNLCSLDGFQQFKMVAGLMTSLPQRLRSFICLIIMFSQNSTQIIEFFQTKVLSANK